jgi:hypothetical protein
MAVAGSDLSLRDRSNLILLDRTLHDYWELGHHVMLNWCTHPGGIRVLIVPHHALASYANDGNAGNSAPTESFLQSLLSGRRQLEPGQLDKVARLLAVEPTVVPLPSPAVDGAAQDIVERIIKRYSITYTPNRAVALFDIVGFGLLNPIEQMLQINSLSYSLNSAQSKLNSKKLGVDFARTTTGDGFYVWNRDLTLDASINLFHLMHLALADNAIARAKASANAAPRLRACFHIGGCYEFHQPEGLTPTIYSYIVGDVTIELARMIEWALADQIMVGDFRAEMPFLERQAPGWVTLDSIDFVARATRHVAQLRGLTLSGDRVDYIRCYLTGAKLTDGEFTVRRILVKDKHGRVRTVYNSKANIYRRNGTPLLLGIEDRVIAADLPTTVASEHVVRRDSVRFSTPKAS